MPFMPIAVVPMWALGLLSVIMLVGGGYVIYEWWEGAAISAALLTASCVSVACSLFGRSLVLFAHRGGHDDPTWTRSSNVERLVRPDGTIIQVETSGNLEGPRAILVHGWGVDSRAFFYTKRALSETHCVVAWDLRGFGASTVSPAKDYSLDAMADDLAAIVALSGGRAILCGHSIGGMIIQTFARRSPELFRERVIATVLANTTYTDPVKTTIAAPVMTALQRPLFVPLMYLTIALSPIVRLMNVLSYINGTLLISTALSGFSGGESRGLLDFATRFMVKANPGVVARGMLAMFRWDETNSLNAMPMPVLLVPGKDDPVLLASASETMRTIMGKASFMELAPGRHMSCIERHVAFHEAMASFLEMHAVTLDARLPAVAAK